MLAMQRDGHVSRLVSHAAANVELDGLADEQPKFLFGHAGTST
jgi:hypothetical protein